MSVLRYSNTAMLCLNCGSPATRRRRRTLTCRSCEVCYIVPARELVRPIEVRAQASVPRPRPREWRPRRERERAL